MGLRDPVQTLLALAVAVTAMTFARTPAAADPVADFYRGKTISMVIGVSVGGDYDIRARLLARHMGKHIPGEPTILPRNMPGAGGVTAANWLARVAPTDGTVILMITQNMPVSQAIHATGVEFDVRRFNWIGNTSDSPNVINSWYTTGVRTIKDAMERELVLGATGRGTGTYYYPASLNALVGTKFKIVAGYPGGNEMNLAMERGEIGGRARIPGRRGRPRGRNGSPRRRSTFWCRSG